MSKSKKRLIYPVLYGLALTGFTAYALLDTFVIARNLDDTAQQNEVDTSSLFSSFHESSSSDEGSQDVGAESEEDQQDEAAESEGLSEDDTSTEGQEDEESEQTPSAVSTENSYSDENITITIEEYREYDTTIYVADIVVSSPEYIKAAFAEGTYGRNIKEKTSEIAEEAGAILAINGDFYGAQSEGYVLRNGVVYRDESSGNEDLAILTDGSFCIFNEDDVTTDELVSMGAWQVLSFGPALLEDGSISVDSSDEVGKAMASNPRTAIVCYDTLHYAFVVSDGRTDESEGLSLYELAEFIQSLGANTAYNLDGGGSSTMYFDGEVINNPTTSGNRIKERSVSDIVYIGY